MKIVFWVERIFPELGGIETFTRQLLPALLQRCHKIIIVCSHISAIKVEEDLEFGFPIYRFPFSTALNNRDLRLIKGITQQANHVIQTFQPDILHLNSILSSAFFYLRIPDVIRPPTLFTLHSNIIKSRAANSLQHQLVRKVDHIVGVSEASLAHYIESYPEMKTPTSVIHNSLPIPSTKPTILPMNPPVILCVGRLTYQKGFDYALNAFNLVLKVHPDARLIIAGDGEERGALEQQAVEFGIVDTVRFAGWVHPDQIPDLMNQATVIFMPSRDEPFGLVALESAQMARPIVASCIDGLKEVVVHQKTGLLTKPGDVHDMAERLIFLLDHPDIATQYGQAAKERAQAEYLFSEFVDKYEALYYKVAGK
ncbi:MAG: glycosyltransferase family 4 protein [Anaerolineae bacterium]|nr:glycosyltransferase family 4 protein [Anaerolineae bacterium]